MSNLNGPKIGLSIGLLIITLVFGLLPFCAQRLATSRRVIKVEQWNAILDLLNSATGGIFLSLFLIHLLPEVHDDLSDALHKAGVFTSFPITEFIVSMGFFLVILFELPYFLIKKQHNEHNTSTKYSKEIEETSICDSDNENLCNQPEKSYGTMTVENDEAKTKELTISTEHSLTHREFKRKPNHQNVLFRIIAMFFALSVHYIFEGLALGIVQTQSQLVAIAIAIFSHKWLLALGFGVKISQSALTTCRSVAFISILAVMTPIGVAIGVIIQSLEVDELKRNLVTEILKALATGTFLYVTFFEVLNKNNESILHILFMIIGFALLTALQFVA